MKRIFYIVDVFTKDKYAGNQLAVFRNAGTFTCDEMQKIAREMNFSETTFILSDQKSRGGYNVRIFTPRAELSFAGHPTLGTAFIIQREIIIKRVTKVILNLKVGQIPVSFGYRGNEPGIIWMEQKQPVFGRVYPAALMAKVIGTTPFDIDARFPVQEVSTGMYAIIVPLKTFIALRNVKVNIDAYRQLMEHSRAVGILVFTPSGHVNKKRLRVRFFAPLYGIAEDPATGSANGCLAGYLVKHGYYNNNKIDILVEQGHEIDRPSLLHLRAKKIKNRIDVHVGGCVKMVARGELA